MKEGEISGAAQKILGNGKKIERLEGSRGSVVEGSLVRSGRAEPQGGGNAASVGTSEEVRIVEGGLA